jgi:hypothetical protein
MKGLRPWLRKNVLFEEGSENKYAGYMGKTRISLQPEIFGNYE